MSDVVFEEKVMQAILTHANLGWAVAGNICRDVMVLATAKDAKIAELTAALAERDAELKAARTLIALKQMSETLRKSK